MVTTTLITLPQVYFSVYTKLIRMVPEADGELGRLGRSFALGTTAGVVATMANTPTDVAKSRIQVCTFCMTALLFEFSAPTPTLYRFIYHFSLKAIRPHSPDNPDNRGEVLLVLCLSLIHI
jgi:transmembrane carrier protein